MSQTSTLSPAGSPTGRNADPKEIDKFSELAHRWWDPNSEFKPLHDLNPLRLGWIDGIARLPGKQVIDVGCGGGILSESMARLGATVRGIDLSTKALKVADLHSLESGVPVTYEEIAVEDLAARIPGSVDVVTCMEMLEHVPDPASIVRACTTLVRPGGYVFFSTINRNLKAYLLAIVGAEYVLNMLPRGTHDYEKFITPSEMARFARQAGLDLIEMRGMTYNPLSQTYSLGHDTGVNYMMAFRKTAPKAAD
ncbi:3-demethylubiquinone-9 3-methyltransferase [Cupriavidus sp. OV038]|jgi:2-polyprenyl-6-hydroxyphenyl methylase/3-demethylubiquinone-9 3-methyltransferase|uniref:bifunctional 2-polyprenyl-6-hydroxyphenol methylase/3-demethylubiquinol 3-O-methyltransferase UbiG n=1 Tax=unclassified Cupriavidus TaxID=2640874 RepID=UPI0008E7B17A|nr:MULTISPECIES: bifunctional 2-polyprenyl-6-hydroxyphenol methylase/3-demethylubiquinol 3-O-methyltransferase UbiG [unclassified Cupriavidus]SFD07758.1 3-demethylubiquinone-9 3-methyltransferase [Cupriavidus sp. OV038]SFP77900.1 3-demethylubiquinone-9 3-methyltransferase [Cupriavidus sp. OV096]